MRTYSAGIATAYGSAVRGGYEGTYEQFCSALGQLADVLEEFEGFSVSVTTLAEGSSATASYDNGVLTLGIPKGDTGATGNGIASAVLNSDYTLTLSFTDGTSYTTPSIRGVQGEQGIQGVKGDTGNGISSITKTATVGKVDTYTITYTDGTTTTFDVTNGQDGITDFASYLPTDTANGTIASFSDGAEDIPVEDLKVTLEPIQSGSGDPSPDNIRPISGWDAVNVTDCGKNLFDDSVTIGTIDCYSLTGESASQSGFDYHLPSGTYTLSVGSVFQTYVYMNIVNADGSWVSSTRITGNSSSKWSPTFSLADGQYIKVFYASSGALDISNADLQIELGSTATDYAEYNGTTYPITLPQTVYGGVFDVTSGVLTVDRAIVDLGTLTWTKPTATSYMTFASNSLTDSIQITGALSWDGMLCTQYGAVEPKAGDDNYIYRNSVGQLRVKDTSKANMTASEFKSAVDGVMLVYPLATPTTITLTPTEVTTLLGDNNIWADSGTVEVTYRADIQQYVDGTIVDVPLAMIAPIENGTTSSKAYAVGEYFILNGTQFCKALTSIASGATFTLNTNYTVTTIGAELKSLQ